ncbi:MAG: hypothetical protein HOI55_06520 [Candidatus Marinimicrobia bacterium]|nr:hypothetical protein [Candidatus Neomarinimicrobiota bacterium]
MSKLPVNKWVSKIDTSQVEDIEIDGINPRDYPDFCDAFILEASYKGREMTDEELEALNEDSDFVYEQVMEHLY